MKKPINEIERLKLMAGLINEVEYNDSVYGVKRTTLTEGKKKKEVKEVSIDVANPYEYRMGLQYELEQMDDYSNESLEKAKSIVLKNLAKDVNFYTTLLNQDQSPYKFEAPETDKPGMQARPDGHLKKELKKDEKANVQDSLGKKEEGSKKPKGVKIMPDKGVTGSEKTIKEGLEDEDEFDLDAAFETSPSSHSYEDVLSIIESYEDERVLNAFKAKFPEGKDISRDAYLRFTMNWIDDMSEVSYIKANWIDITDSDIFDKAGLVEIMPGLEEAFNLKTAFKSSPSSHSYNDVLDIFTSYEDEGILNDFKANFPEGEDISKIDYMKFAILYIDDMSASSDIMANWISVTDPDVYKKAGLVEIMPGVNLGASFDKLKGQMSAEDEFEALVKKYDWYAEMSDDSRKWDAQQAMEAELRQLAKIIGVDKAVEIFNKYAPSDRKVTSSDSMWMNEDKHSKIKEALKAALKKEILDPKDIQAAKKLGTVVRIPATDSSAVTQAKNAKINYSTYQ